MNGTAKHNRIPVIFSDHKELLNTYFNLLDGYYADSVFHSDYIKRLKQEASELVEYFKNKYDFS